MGRKRKNTFSKALGHLKSTKITEAAPVNSTTGVYSITPGTLTRVEPGPDVPDYSTIDWDVDGGDGKDTSGLFDSNGDSKFIAPPGDNSYILGPMSAMYYTWSYPWTMVGYIRESDRRMVNLGRIDGKLGDWDGSSGNGGSGTGTFYSYGQLTTEQALWFRDTNKKDNAGNDPDNANYRAFYPGPPSNTPDAFGRYYCTITGTPIAEKTSSKTVAPIDLQASDILSAIMDRLRNREKLSKAEQEFLDKYNENRSPLDKLKDLWDDGKEEVGNWLNKLKDIAKTTGKYLNLAGSGVEAVPTSADALQQYLNNNDPNHPDYRTNDPRSDNYTGPYEPPTDQTWRNEVGQQIKDSIPKWSDWEQRANNSPDGKTQLTNFEINSLSQNMKPLSGNGDMRFHTFFNSLPVSGDEHSDQVPGEDGNEAITTVTIDKDGNIDIVSNYRFSDRDDVSSGGPLMKMYVQSYMDKDKGDEGTFPFYDKDQRYDNRTQTGTTHDVNMRLRLNINGGNSSTWPNDSKAKATDVKNFKTNMMKLMNSYSIDYKPEHLLSESRKTNILKNLKNPVVLPETKQKSYKVNPGRRLKTNFQGMDKLVNDITTQEPFKRKADVWSKDWQGYNSRLSQDKKNMVLELIGDGKHYFDYMLSDSKIKNAEEMEKFWGLHPEMHSYFYNGKKHKATRKEEVKGDMIVFMEDENGVKSTILQSELNLILEAEHEKEMLSEYNKLNEPTPFFKDPLMKKVAKRLKNEIEYEGKPAVKGYPDEPPAKQVDGWHPEYGKKYKYDKLDPVSAVMMKRAPTGDPEIDANVEKAARKPKVKVKEERSDWREEIG